MIIKAIKTHKITQTDTEILKVLDQYVEKLEENSVIAVTSKIISICEGRIVKLDSANRNLSSSASPNLKDELIEQESELFLPRSENKYNVSFTITNNILSAMAGIDESNGNGYYILWPSDLQGWANKIREHLCQKFGLENLGVVISDSKTTPLRWGVTGIALAHSGFMALKDYVGKPDLFNRPFVYEKLNIADSIASSAVLVMGEGSEQTPLAIIEDLKNIEFQDRNPSDEELESLKIKMEDDLFAPFLKNADWQKGGKD